MSAASLGSSLVPTLVLMLLARAYRSPEISKFIQIAVFIPIKVKFGIKEVSSKLTSPPKFKNGAH